MVRKIVIVVALLVAVAAIAAGIAVGAGVGDDSEPPITGPALERASDAALAHTGGGSVTETEVGDEESYYEVEVTLPGRQPGRRAARPAASPSSATRPTATSRAATTTEQARQAETRSFLVSAACQARSIASNRSIARSTSSLSSRA